MERQAVANVQKTPARANQLQTQSARSSAVAYPLLELQRSIGNQAVQRLIRSPYIQTKLQISTPGDPFEQEADRVADSVMRMAAPQPATEEEEEPLQTKSLVTGVTPLAQRVTEQSQAIAAPTHSSVNSAPPRIQRATAQTSGQMNAAPASVNRTLASTGRLLEPELRQDMEQRFGYDLSRVRLHSGEAAEQSAREVNAHAYTVGHNIVFGSGRFAPGTHEGMRLLAHEITHVVQQSGPLGDRVGQSKERFGLYASGLQQRSFIPAHPTAIQPGLLQRDDKGPKPNQAAQAKRAKIEAAMQKLKAKFSLGDVSEENKTTWTESELARVDAAFSKMSTDEQAKLKGLFLIRTDQLSVERKGKKISVVGMTGGGGGWIKLTSGAFKSNMVTLHEAGHVIHKQVVREVEEKQRKSKTFTDLEAARQKFMAAIGKNPRISGTAEQVAFVNSISQVTRAAEGLLNSEEADRETNQNLVDAAQALSDVDRTPVEKTQNDPTSKVLLEAHNRQRDWVTAVGQWLDEKAKAVGPRKNLTEFVDIVNKNKLARKSFAPFTDYVAKFWPDEPGEFFAESYATWRNQPNYLKTNAKPLFEWFEKKGHLLP